MASRLAMRVLESNLPPHLKPTAATMALFADVDGENIFPGIDRVAWLLGVDRSTIKRHFRALRELGMLVPLTPLQNGRGLTVRYRMRFPQHLERENFKPKNRGVHEPFTRKGCSGEPISEEKVSPMIERVANEPERVSPAPEYRGAGEPRSGSDLELDQGEETARQPATPTASPSARASFLELLNKTHPNVAKQFEKAKDSGTALDNV